MPVWRRDVVDNPRYVAEGGQVGFETKRGCPRACDGTRACGRL